jgi:hypothetical protein
MRNWSGGRGEIGMSVDKGFGDFGIGQREFCQVGAEKRAGLVLYLGRVGSGSGGREFWMEISILEFNDGPGKNDTGVSFKTDKTTTYYEYWKRLP